MPTGSSSSSSSSNRFATPEHPLSTRSESALLARIQGEFREMPGLCLTGAQARRLWQLDAGTCDSLLDELVTRGFLTVTEQGRYVRPF